RSLHRPPSTAWSPANSAARNRWRGPRPARSLRPSSAWDARSRSAAGRARPASPFAPRARRAPAAAPRAGDASPHDFCRWRCAAARTSEFTGERGAGLERALLARAGMDEHVARLLLSVGDGKSHALAAHDAGVADLTARLRVERRLVEDDGAALAGTQRVDFVP